MELSRQEYWSGLPCLPPGDLLNTGIKPRSSALQADSLPSESQGLVGDFISSEFFSWLVLYMPKGKKKKEFVRCRQIRSKEKCFIIKEGTVGENMTESSLCYKQWRVYVGWKKNEKVRQILSMGNLGCFREEFMFNHIYIGNSLSFLERRYSWKIMFGKIALVTYRKDFEWREIEREKNKNSQSCDCRWGKSTDKSVD